ncbi:hypothetical protein QKU48_gp0497 [Fadolivirus algeromassiliense]|jgi:hypothetical protein|uniref:Uncharacterized protein n=1 Tax=Fadolivirus FV1/VV64 TaxID=3070911 RepID=A0A7D3V5F3_9VIRU|nr:hypothetical protein QKU48_gp0497 [Fadolivirus algeromassiliense]QKF93955.1 hypothetical protein Fadolivirus_1_497 [Fadolivirus FV1/VV64]
MQFNNDNDSVFSDEGSLHSAGNGSRDSLNINNDHMAFFKKGNILQNNNYHQKKYVNEARNEVTNGFLNQFDDLAYDNPSDPVSSNNTPHKKGNNANVARMEMERDLALKGNYSNFENNNDMTYGIVDEKNFVHNNMTPFYKSGVGKGYGPNSNVQKQFDDVKQRKLELFSGSTKSVDYRPKTERKPLFNPQVGLTWIYGMPNFTDYFESRYIPSRERRNEMVHQPVRITPGLNLGYNEVSKQGFHDTYRVLPKTVDELRAANDPKISYEGRVIAGKKGDRRSIIPNVAKHRPIKFKEQDPRDMLKSLGYYRAPSLYGNYEAPHTNRQQTTRAWYGPVEMLKDEPRPESMMEKFKLPFRENFLSPTPRNTTGVESQKNTSYTSNSYYLNPTNRTTTAKNGYVNPAGPEYNKGHAFDMISNIPDPTKRNTTELRNWNNAAGPEYKKGHAFDMISNIPDPTKRNTTELRNWNNAAGPEYKKGHAFDMVSNIPDPTLRNATEKNVNLIGQGTEWQKHVAFDMNSNIPDPTLRNMTEKNVNLIGQGTEWQKHIAFDMLSNIPDPTLRNITEKNTNLVGQGTEWKKPVAFDMNSNIPDPTLRNLTEKNTNLIGHGTEWQKHVAFDMKSNIPDPTLRDLIQKNTNLIGQGTEWQKPVAFDMKSNIPDPTLRDLIQKNTNLGNAAPEWQKGGYQVEHFGTVAPSTLRQLTQNNTQLNPVGTSQFNKGGYTAELDGTIAPPTLRQMTQINSQLNPVGPNERAKGGYHAEQAGTIAPPTLRQLTQVNTTLNPAGPNDRERGGYQVAVQNTVAPPTLRQMTQNKTQLNPAGPNDREKGGYQVEVQNTVAPPTLRQLTQVNSQLNPAGPNEREKGGYQVEVQNTVAPTTLRQLTQNKTYQGPLLMNDASKTRSRGDANNSLVNVGKERAATVRDGGRPTTSNYEVGPIYDYTMVQLCEPIEINRDIYGQALWQNPLQCMPTMYTRMPHQLPQVDQWRLDTCVLSNLNSNPYINNVVHKSIQY